MINVLLNTEEPTANEYPSVTFYKIILKTRMVDRYRLFLLPLTIICAFAILIFLSYYYDDDFSDDHDPLKIQVVSGIFIDHSCKNITILKFINKPINFSLIDKPFIINKAPPA